MPIISTLDPFFSSKFSVEWAKDHIKEFEGRAVKFFKEDSHSVFTEPDVDSAYQLLKVRFNPILPRAFLGHSTDVVYNLRAALDQTISSIATLNNTPKKYCSFPITNSEHWMEVALGKLKSIMPQAIADIVRAFKPYKGGNDLIWALNELCNTSKHGLLHAVPAAVNFSVSGPRTVKGEQPESFLTPIWDSSKSELTIARLPIGAEHTVNSDVAFTVGFGEIEPITGKEVIPTLYEFVDIIEGLVMAIEAESIRIGLI